MAAPAPPPGITFCKASVSKSNSHHEIMSFCDCTEVCELGNSFVDAKAQKRVEEAPEHGIFKHALYLTFLVEQRGHVIANLTAQVKRLEEEIRELKNATI